MPTRWIQLIALLSGAAAAVAQTPAYDRSGNTVVLRYQEHVGALAADEPGPSVEVYGDGRVVVRYPAYMKQAGVYTTQIAPEDVAALVDEAVGAGIVGFDRAATAAAVQQAETARSAAQKRSGKPVILSDVSDPPTTVIEATLLPEPGKRSSKVVASARWNGLARDAERYPEIGTLRELANVEKQLRGLMQRSDLRPESDLQQRP